MLDLFGDPAPRSVISEIRGGAAHGERKGHLPVFSGSSIEPPLAGTRSLNNA